MRHRCTLPILLGVLGCASTDPDPTAAGPTTDPAPLSMVDAHIHKVPGQSDDELLALAHSAGLAGITVLGPVPAVALAQTDPDFVSAFVFVDGDRFTDPTMPASVQDALAQGAVGVGELSIRHFAAGGEPAVDLDPLLPPLLALYDLAADARVPLTVHYDWHPGQMDAFVAMLEHNPDARFIWAHAGDGQPAEVRSMIEAHHNLYADLSCRNPFYERGEYTVEEQSMAEPDGLTLAPEWKALIDDHPDRFLWGTDVGPGDRYTQIVEVTDFYRTMLGQLDPGAAEGVAGANFARLRSGSP